MMDTSRWVHKVEVSVGGRGGGGHDASRRVKRVGSSRLANHVWVGRKDGGPLCNLGHVPCGGDMSTTSNPASSCPGSHATYPDDVRCVRFKLKRHWNNAEGMSTASAPSRHP